MELLLAVLMLSLSFFFSGMEIAFLSANRLKIELKTRQGSLAGTILSNFTKRTSEVLITILIGNNLALVIFTIMVERLTTPPLQDYLHLDPEFNWLVFTLVQTILSTLTVLVLAEYIPKAFFRSNSDQIVFPAAYVLRFFYVILYVPVWGVNLISKFLLRVFFGVTTEEKIVVLDKKDLDQYIQEVIAGGEGVDMTELDLDTEMLTNALAFKETKARECMIPRTEIVATSIEVSVSELIDLFIATQLSKIIIYEESLDQVRGFVHSSSMFQRPERVSNHIQPVLIVPESMPANMLLAELTENQRSVAIVVDEFGGTAGMITMEDLVEEVFGEIEDEYDQDKYEPDADDLVKLPNPDGSYLLGARLEIDDLNEEFDLDLPEEEYYTTLGGLVMYVAENIPQKDEYIRLEKYIVTVIKATDTRVICVKLQRAEDE